MAGEAYYPPNRRPSLKSVFVPMAVSIRQREPADIVGDRKFLSVERIPDEDWRSCDVANLVGTGGRLFHEFRDKSRSHTLAAYRSRVSSLQGFKINGLTDRRLAWSQLTTGRRFRRLFRARSAGSGHT